MNRVVLASALQYNSITAAMCAIVWIASRKHWLKADQEPETALSLLRLLVGFAIASNVVLIGPVCPSAGPRIPTGRELCTAATGDLHGWTSLILCAAAGLGLAKEFKLRISALPLFAFVLAVGILVAFGLAPLGTDFLAGLPCASSWHVHLQVGDADFTRSGFGDRRRDAWGRFPCGTTSALERPIVSRVRCKRRQNGMSCAGLIVVFLGIRASGYDPNRLLVGYRRLCGYRSADGRLELYDIQYSVSVCGRAPVQCAASVWWITRSL